MSKYETIGGHVTRGECFAKVLDLLDQLRDQVIVMSHLHNTETNDTDKILAKGWLGMSELLGRLREQFTKLAMRKLQ